MRKETVGTDNVLKATARTVVTSLLICVVGLYAIAFIMNRIAEFPSIDLGTEDAVYTITRNDGTTEKYHQNHFSLVNYGETMTCRIDPLKDDVSSIQNGTLVFTLYHSYVTVYCGDKVIYNQKAPAKGKLIGHRYYVVPLPDGYEDQTITIRAVCAEHDTFNSIQDFKIIPASRTTYAFRSGHFATGILLITLLILSIFMEITSIVTWIREKHNDGLLAISFLCSCVSLWYMGFAGYLQPFVESTGFLAVAEYIGIYATPLALSLFIQSHTVSRRLHLFCVAESIILTVFFAFASLMTIFADGVSYVDYIAILRILFLFTLILLFIAEIREWKTPRDIGEKTLHVGITITIIIGTLELVRFLLDERLSDKYPWISNSIMPLCILSLVATALMFYGVRVTAIQYQRIEQENLRRLAFVDQLTGAPNRAACYRRLDDRQHN
jgi:hypothetical protein